MRTLGAEGCYLPLIGVNLIAPRGRNKLCRVKDFSAAKGRNKCSKVS